MARDRDQIYTRPVRRLVTLVLAGLMLLIFLFWRIDSPRAERLRAQVLDRVLPPMDWAMAPVTGATDMLRDFRSYTRLYEQNQELRRELRKMDRWREAALQLEQENAKLMDLNNMRLAPELTFITATVMADSGSPFRQSMLVNVGRHDGLRDGWAATDGLGLVGRISGLGDRTARVLLLTDPASRLPVTIQPGGQHGILVGDNAPLPLLDFLETPEAVRPGDRLVTSGAGQVFPAGILVGSVVKASDGRLRARLSADYERLEFLRILRSFEGERLEDPGTLVAPLPDMQGPALPEAAESTDG